MFTEGKIGTLKTKNRFIRSATAEFGANSDGTITPLYFELYRQLSMNEIGVIIQGHLYILEEGKAHDRMAGISQKFHLERLNQLTKIVHESQKSSIIMAQLNHGGMYSVSKKAPSLLEDKKTVGMTNEDIENVITGFKSAAKRAKKVGYDAIQIHAAHGYLINQFLSTRTNKRNDAWGNSLENRASLLLNIYQSIRDSVGASFPILVKMNGSDDPFDGFPIAESIKVAKWLAKEGVDALEVSGMKSTRKIEEQESTYFVPFAKEIKKHVGDMPISVVGGFRYFSTMQRIRDNFADFISISRPFIRESDLILKFKDGKEKADCISCNNCFNVEDIVKCRADI
jgi:2,4-dienoyl-CoA reductase-like NADH-dependent reductase (Old Yellow Enzyme family)